MFSSKGASARSAPERINVHADNVLVTAGVPAGSAHFWCPRLQPQMGPACYFYTSVGSRSCCRLQAQCLHHTNIHS